MAGQVGDAGNILFDAVLAAFFRIQYGLFQAWDQCGKAAVDVIAAQGIAQLLHALIDRLVAAFRRQRAAHQAATQQVQACLPAALKFFLLFQAFQVLAFPALGIVGHHRHPVFEVCCRVITLQAGDNLPITYSSTSIGGAGPQSEVGKRICTATGR